MKLLKTSEEMLIFDWIMSLFLWSKIFRVILALPPGKISPVRLWLRPPFVDIAQPKKQKIVLLKFIWRTFQRLFRKTSPNRIMKDL